MKPARTLAVLLTAVSSAVATTATAASAQQVSPSPSPSCSNLGLSAPTDFGIGRRIPVLGFFAQPGQTVQVLFRKRGQTGFTVRRSLNADAQGRFAFSYLADDDYRLYARTGTCQSSLQLLQPAPTITGPTIAPVGATVTLTARAAPLTRISVAFSRVGQTDFVTRRYGTTDAAGLYRTSYRSDAEYSYVARSQSGRASAPGRTSVQVDDPRQPPAPPPHPPPAPPPPAPPALPPPVPRVAPVPGDGQQAFIGVCVGGERASLAPAYLGLTEDQAVQLNPGGAVRVIGRDGTCLARTADYRPARVNLILEDGEVVWAGRF